jgi:uncharacterized protein YjcR
MRAQKQRDLAERLFVEEGQSLNRIAELLGASVTTIANWSRQGKWKERRTQRRGQSPQAALDDLKRLRAAVIAAKDAKPEADPEAIGMLHKLNAEIAKMESKRDEVDEVGLMLDVFERFAEFVGTNADDAALAVIREWTEKFLDEERRRNI